MNRSLIAFFLFSLAHSSNALAGPLAGPLLVYVSESEDNRIAVFSLNETDGTLTRTGALDLAGSPGSLALRKDRSRLYASVRSTVELASIKVNPVDGSLSSPQLAPAGHNAAYVHLDPTERWLLSASYSDGKVSVSRIEDGSISGPPVQSLATGPKAHCVLTDAAGRFAFVPHVMTLNRVVQFQFDAASGRLTPNTPPHLDGAEGAGPRHMAFHPNGRWAYLVNEQGQSVTHCDYDAASGTLTRRETLSTTPPTWDKTKGSCADIHVSADGRFVYASNRGHDSLACFAVDATTGALSARGQTPTEKTPRSFALSPGSGDLVVAAGQGSNTLIVYRRDLESGALTPLRTTPCGKSPAWVLMARF